MTRGNYSAEYWRGNGADRARWAVHCAETGVYYFPSRYGREAAESLARRMNGRAVA